MEWSKAQNTIITILIILNLILYLVLISENKYIVTKKQKNSLINVLSNNNIEFFADIITEFKPKKRIVMSKYDFLKNSSFKEAFFESPTNIQIIDEKKSTILTDMTGTLSIYESYIFYESASSESDIKNTKDNLLDNEKISKKFIKSLGKEFSNFSLDNKYETIEGDVYYYRELFKGFFLNNNFIKIVINNKKISKVILEYFKPLSFANEEKREIISPDEALITFMRNYDNQTDKIIIENMRLVYNIEHSSSDKELFNAIPCYSIYLKNSEEPVLINAYYNTIVQE